MSHISVLPFEVEECLKTCKNEKLKENRMEAAFPNPLLRDDVLDLLDRFCTVVYFPIKNEENNGFHITDVPFCDGTKQNFVFINTAQTMEKQVFTAAHELGHIWKVDDYVIENLHLEDTDKLREMIINRFAAVLLIPDEIFRISLAEELKKLDSTNGSITVKNMLKLVVILMNQFFAPMKAIVLRFVELGYLTIESAELLLGYGEIPKEKIDATIQELISDYGYIKFQTPSNKKWIEHLAELLETAEKEHLVSEEKIDHLRKMFDLKPKSINEDMNDMVSLVTQKGFDT